MMPTPLNLFNIFDYSQKMWPEKWIITRTHEGTHRYRYRDFGERVRRLSSALKTLGVEPGDRVATLAWNNYRHLEAYFAIPLMGAVLHTVNLRLPSEHLRYIINHAEDRILLVDEELLPLLDPIRDQLPTVQHLIVLGDQPDLSKSPIVPVSSYEVLLGGAVPTGDFDPDLPEDSPLGMCYTSATTGNPKGVVYSHRGIVLHSLAMGLANTSAIAENDTVMPVVPMFHANAWGIPFSSIWFGANIVLPGPAPTPADLVRLMSEERVSVSAGVPTVWLGVAKALEKDPTPLSLRMVLCGGSAAPPALIRTFEETFDVPFAHAYGMTETSPLATFARLKSTLFDLPKNEQLAIRSTQGLLVPGLFMRLVREHEDAPWDGKSMGELWLKGPWVADEYYHDPRTEDSFEDGWLKTGDVATISPEGYVRLVDRTKDLVKSGGEWISSVDLENAIMAHPDVFEAAVVGVPHPKWDERPLAFVVPKEDREVRKEDVMALLSENFPKWWLPDDVIFLPEIPKTSVGKFMKRALRDQYHQYLSSSQ
ncbi:MAG: fatty-acid--CoA ligase [Sulfobacillus benefaciens]|uniref:Fatty-acid--CoA ligase n=1 Tax=Sulfobacillus benefaciens TaxID=453960 RepID=A0A2T2X966_9FIRM|nr:MAG: fatty-acid--CoA ligase [Sulfobacillus benefaciens]